MRNLLIGFTSSECQILVNISNLAAEICNTGKFINGWSNYNKLQYYKYPQDKNE